MRELLFRGESITNRKWVYGDLRTLKDLRVTIHKDGEIFPYEVIPETVGQYTCLFDKNDVEIYEGDIIRSTETGETAVVQWSSEYAAFMVRCISSNKVGFLHECEESIIEVIGNIHDNPEMLKGE